METQVIVWLALGALALFYVFMSLVIIQANEKAVLFIWGSAIRVIGPGPHFCPWLFSGITRYSMEPIVFKIKVPTAITKNGRVEGYKEDGDDEIERAELDVFLTLITYFSDDNVRLLKTAKRASGDVYEILNSAITPFIMDVVRSVFSEMPWILSYQERKCVLDYMLSRVVPEYEYFSLESKVVKSKNGKKSFNSYYFESLKQGHLLKKGEDATKMERYNPLVQFRLDMSRTSIIIDDVNFCNLELAKILSSAETARLQSEADLIKSIRDADKIRKIGYAEADVTFEKGKAEADVTFEKGKAEADARRRMIAEIKNNPDLEFLRSLEEMAKGTSNTILYQIPAAFEDRVSKILGGNKPTDFLSLLKDPAVLKTIKDAVQKITKP